MLFQENGTERARFATGGKFFVAGTTAYSGGSEAGDAILQVNGAVARKATQFSDFNEAYTDSPLGIFEGTSSYQASNRPLASAPVGIGSGGNFFHLVARTVATSGSSSNNYVLLVAYGLTGLQYTRYSSNNGSSWSQWSQKTS